MQKSLYIKIKTLPLKKFLALPYPLIKAFVSELNQEKGTGSHEQPINNCYTVNNILRFKPLFESEVSTKSQPSYI